jgi:hypothetical protein
MNEMRKYLNLMESSINNNIGDLAVDVDVDDVAGGTYPILAVFDKTMGTQLDLDLEPKSYEEIISELIADSKSHIAELLRNHNIENKPSVSDRIFRRESKPFAVVLLAELEPNLKNRIMNDLANSVFSDWHGEPVQTRHNGEAILFTK